MILPEEWIENSIETYIYQRTTKSQIIYWVVLYASCFCLYISKHNTFYQMPFETLIRLMIGFIPIILHLKVTLSSRNVT